MIARTLEFTYRTELTYLSFGPSGMLFGGLIWGAMSDIIGRRITLLILLFAVFVFETLAAAVLHQWQLFLVKVCSGFMCVITYLLTFDPVIQFQKSELIESFQLCTGVLVS